MRTLGTNRPAVRAHSALRSPLVVWSSETSASLTEQGAHSLPVPARERIALCDLVFMPRHLYFVQKQDRSIEKKKNDTHHTTSLSVYNRWGSTLLKVQKSKPVLCRREKRQNDPRTRPTRALCVSTTPTLFRSTTHRQPTMRDIQAGGGARGLQHVLAGSIESLRESRPKIKGVGNSTTFPKPLSPQRLHDASPCVRVTTTTGVKHAPPQPKQKK